MSDIINDAIDLGHLPMADATKELASDVERMARFDEALCTLYGYQGQVGIINSITQRATEFWRHARGRVDGDDVEDYCPACYARNASANASASLMIDTINEQAVALYKAIGDMYLRRMRETRDMYITSGR